MDISTRKKRRALTFICNKNTALDCQFDRCILSDVCTKIGTPPAFMRSYEIIRAYAEAEIIGAIKEEQ